MLDQDRPVHIIGAGPGGLATAAALRQRGVRAIVLERSASVGAAWRGHYDRLRLHTTRGGSALPGLPIPRSAGRWVSRDDLVRYLEAYTEHHRLEIATGVEVSHVERAEPSDGADESGTGWTLRANGGRVLHAPALVVATGLNHTPAVPDWPGSASFTGELQHAAHYRTPAPYEDKDVLVVGAGNSGTEIAVDLYRGGARNVRLSVRTPPHLVRRGVLGWPSQSGGIFLRRLPVAVADRLASGYAKATTPDLSERGLPRPETGLVTRARAGTIPVVDTGLIKAVRGGGIRPVAAVAEFDGSTVRLTDGTELAPDVVIAATGYRSGLSELVGHLGVLDADGLPTFHGRRTVTQAPGLYFTGYTTPVSGTLRELGRDAAAIAKALSKAAAKST